MSTLGTTTWKRRNTDKLETAKRFIVDRPVIINYGPGGIVGTALEHLPQGHSSTWSPSQKLQRGVLKFTESVVRKTRLFDLHTSEPAEIADLFSDVAPEALYVVDREQRVIDAVLRLKKDLPIPVHTYRLDLDKGVLPYQGDLVIAYNMIERTSRPDVALEHIAQSVKVGGLLSTTYNCELPQFKQLEESLYVKH